MKKLSVIIPVYNTEGFLKKCFDSIIICDSPMLEVIIIDDGSVDNSAKIIQFYMNYDKRIVYKYQKNSGVSIARNNGLKMANGEFVLFIDSDDFIDNKLLDRVIEKIENRDADIIKFGYKEIEGEMIVSVYKPKLYNTKIEFLEKMSMGQKFEKMPLVTFAFRKDISVGITFYEGCKYGEDQEFVNKIIERANNIDIIEDEYYYYNKNINSAVNKKNFEQLQFIEAMQRVYLYYKEKNENRIAYNYYNIFIPSIQAQKIMQLINFNFKYKDIKKELANRGIDIHFTWSKHVSNQYKLFLFGFSNFSKITYYFSISIYKIKRMLGK